MSHITFYVSEELAKTETEALIKKPNPTGKTWDLIESKIWDTLAVSIASSVDAPSKKIPIKLFNTVNAEAQKKICEKSKILFLNSVELLLQEVGETGTHLINDCFFLEKTTLTKYRHTGIQNANGKVITKNESVEKKMLLNEIPGSYLTDENVNLAIQRVRNFVTTDSVWNHFPLKIHEASFDDLYARGSKLLRKDGPSCYRPIYYSKTPVKKFLFQILRESVINETVIDQDGNPLKPIHKKGISYFLRNGFTKNFIVNRDKKSISDAKIFIQNQILHNQYGRDLARYLEVLAAIYAEEISADVTLENLKELLDDPFMKNSLFARGVDWKNIDLHAYLKLKQMVIETLPEEPRDYFPLARQLRRKFILHVGPTNSGKTYESLVRLKNSGSGIYLAPLRLLALEVQEKMLAQNVLCSLSTGEEEDLIEGARHFTSTIEKLDFLRIYDVAVIDECQLLEDHQRGGAWTAAILGVAAKEVHACMSPHALKLVIQLIEYSGDTYEVIEHHRDTELIIQEKPFHDFAKLEKGDALIVFSRKNVLTLAASINNETDLKCSVLFGGLPYRARRIQFHDFAEARTDILITTDVIGLGVNLAIKRIIFMEDTKFDGVKNRKLKPIEVLQIAGRAGRKNIYDQGTILSKKPEIFKIYHEPIPDLTQAYIGLTHYIGEIDGELKDVLKAWESLDFKLPFVKSNIEENKKILTAIESIPLSKKQRFKAIFIPTYTAREYIAGLLNQYLTIVASGEMELPFPPLPESKHQKELKQADVLKQLEQYARGLDLYYYIGRTFAMNIDINRLEAERINTAQGINSRLLPGKLQSRKCEICEIQLEWDNYKNTCPACYEKNKIERNLRRKNKRSW